MLSVHDFVVSLQYWRSYSITKPGFSGKSLRIDQPLESTMSASP
jgi:hypothetical protein